MNTSRSVYYQTRAFSITFGGQAIKLISKPGIPNWDSVSPAQQLLADTAKPAADARMLLLGCGPGALGVALARQAHAGSAALLDSNWIALAMAERTLNANNVTNARVCSTISLLPEQAGAFDIAMIVPYQIHRRFQDVEIAKPVPNKEQPGASGQPIEFGRKKMVQYAVT